MEMRVSWPSLVDNCHSKVCSRKSALWMKTGAAYARSLREESDRTANRQVLQPRFSQQSPPQERE